MDRQSPIQSPGKGHGGQPWQPLLILAIVLGISSPLALWAKGSPSFICCRASGGTRGTCLNLWAHLVPPGNRFNPGPQRTLLLLQGAAALPTAITVQLTSMAGVPVSEQTLPAQGPGVWLLRLPPEGRLPLHQPMVWESFPSCQPNKPPTRTTLVPENDPLPMGIQRRLLELVAACGTSIDTASLLAQFGLEELSPRLPARLPVRCQTLTLAPLPLTASPGNLAIP